MKTIAIIDDDIHIGDVLTEVLTREGYAVLRAYSGTEAGGKDYIETVWGIGFKLAEQIS